MARIIAFIITNIVEWSYLFGYLKLSHPITISFKLDT